MTVLFADAVGSTTFTEQAGDEAAYRLVQDCTALMVEAVERHGGTVSQFRGDGIMALFGAPVAIEHSAVEAVSSALEMRDALAAYGARLETPAGLGCQFRIGLSTGPVIVGHVGENVLLDYTAIGDTSNVASRMEQSASPGTVLIADSTWRAVRAFVEARQMGELTVKGKSSPVIAHEVLRRRPIRTRMEAALERGLTPFVGRAGELETLLALARDVADGKGNVVEIVGEPGIGKTRLLMELRRGVPDSVVWIEGHCSAGSELPYLPIMDLLRDAFEVDENDDPAAVAARVDRATATWPTDARAVVPYLKYILGVDPGDARVVESDARTRRAAIFEALRVGLVQAASERPRLVVIEDVHWADASSLEVLATLQATSSSSPVLLITTSRPGGTSPFTDAAGRRQLGLDGLLDTAAAAVAANTLGASALPDDVAAMVVGKADGNPLFVEELTATLAESGILARDGDSWRLTRYIEDIEIPGTVEEVILARIDRLAREARDALQLASVIGREFTVRLLDRLAGQADRLDATLDELKAVELIRQKALFPELAYLFKHALTHEVTYATLLEGRRRELHRLVAVAIEEVYADRLAEHVEALAHHWYVAEEWQKAVDYLGRAGDAAAATFSNDAAIAFYRQGELAAERLGDMSAALSCSNRVGNVLMATGDLAPASEAFARVEVLAEALGDIESMAWALTLRGQAECYNHEIDRGEPHLLAAIGMQEAPPTVRLYAASMLQGMRTNFGRHDDARALDPLVDELNTIAGNDDTAIAARVRANDAMTARWRGELRRSLDLADAEVPVGTDLLTRQTVVWVKGLTLGELGRFDEALRLLDDLLELSVRTGERIVRARAYNTIGWLRGETGDDEGAIASNQRCLAYLHEIDIPDEEIESNARLNLVDIYVGRGDLNAAAPHVERVSELVQDRPLRDTWALWRYSQHYLISAASFLLARGDIAEVEGRLDDCNALSVSSGSVKYEAKVARLRAVLQLHRHELDAAEHEANRALRIATELEHPAEQWRSSFLLGDIARARADADAAMEHETRGRSLLTAVASNVTDPGVRKGVARLAGSA